MVLTVAALAGAGSIICLVVTAAAMRAIGGGVRETLFYFGIAERLVREPPRVAVTHGEPRRRPAPERTSPRRVRAA